MLYGKSEIVYQESEIAILSVGHMFEAAVEVRNELKKQGYCCTLVNARFVKPIDEALIEELCQDHRLIATIEENVQTGGFGEHVMEYVNRKCKNIRVLSLALPDDYVEHGSIKALREETGLDVETMTGKLMKAYRSLTSADGKSLITE